MNTMINELTDTKAWENRSETPLFDILNWWIFSRSYRGFRENVGCEQGNESTNNVQVFITISSIRLLRNFNIAICRCKIMIEPLSSFQPLSLTAVIVFILLHHNIFNIIFEPCVAPDCFCRCFQYGVLCNVTLTTVGFGENSSNNMARFVAVITMLGAVFLSMPIAVIGNHENAYNDHEKELALKDPIREKESWQNAMLEYT